MNSNSALRVETAHVCMPGALAIMMATPFLKGSVLDEGIVMTTCDGAAMDGMNRTQLLVMWILGSKALLACIVNSPHLRKPANAVVTAASILSLLDKVGCVTDARMRARTSRVIGSLGMRSRSPMYLLMPLMTLWSNGDSHAENDRPPHSKHYSSSW